MESTRRRLLEQLTTDLGAPFIVSDRVATPEQIDPGKIAIRVMTGDITPHSVHHALTVQLIVWATTAAQDPSTVDDQLDAALSDLLTEFLSIPWVAFAQATRGVMDDTWHGYRFTLNAFAQIEEL